MANFVTRMAGSAKRAVFLVDRFQLLADPGKAADAVMAEAHHFSSATRRPGSRACRKR